MDKKGGAMIIAMKGRRGVGKSTVANSIANEFKCPIIDLDHIRDCVARAQQITLPYSDPKKFQFKLDALCYEAICAIGQAQLRSVLKIIIDSPLSRRSHLDRLLQLSISTEAPLVVVECKPQDFYVFQSRLRSARLESRHTWWNRNEEEQFEDYETGDNNNIRKLVVDTTNPFRGLHLRHAIEYLSSHQESLSVDFSDWDGAGFKSISETQHNKNNSNNGQESFHIHKLVLLYDHDKIGGSCEACLEAIHSDPIYHCDGCGLSIHQLCAELPDKKELLPTDYPPFLNSLPNEYYFEEQHRCKSHHKDSLNCSDCLFETNLQYALFPSVINHSCHDQNPLNIRFYPFSNNYEYRCQACGGLGHHVLYNCSVCSFECHVDCALLPHRHKDVHHRHILTITPPPTTKSQDNDHDVVEYCDACERERNPKHWTYSCPESRWFGGPCGFTRHLKCDN